MESAHARRIAVPGTFFSVPLRFTPKNVPLSYVSEFRGISDCTFLDISTIYVSASANAKASKGYGEEYDYLVRLTTQNPTFEISVLPPKKVKQTYKGLTLALMREYVSIQDNCDELLPLFDAMRDLGEARGSKIATAKHWFLKTFTGSVNSLT